MTTQADEPNQGTTQDQLHSCLEAGEGQPSGISHVGPDPVQASVVPERSAEPVLASLEAPAASVLGQLVVHGITEELSILLSGNAGSRVLRVPLGGVKAIHLTLLLKEPAPELSAEDLIRLNHEVCLIARQKPINTTQSLGQGIHWLDGQIVVVSGDQIVSVGPELVPAVASEPVVLGHYVERDQHRKWIETEKLIRRMGAIGADVAKEVYAKVHELFRQHRFLHDDDLLLLNSLVFATAIGACLPIRPRAWVVGPTGCGKTQTLIALNALIPGTKLLDAGTTEAGLRQALQQDTLPILLDEMERNPHRRAILTYLRSATRAAGVTTKGSSVGTARGYMARVLPWLASIDLGTDDAADQNRTIVIRLAKGGTLRLPPREVLAELSIDIVAVAIRYAPEILKRYEHLLNLSYEGEYRRLQCFAIPVAVWAAIHEKTTEEAACLVKSLLNRDRGEEFVPDEYQLLQDILMSRVSVPGLGSGTVADVLDKGHEYAGELCQFGLRLCATGLFVSTNESKRYLLHGTKWAHLNIATVLRHLPGAASRRMRLVGDRSRGASAPSVWGILIPSSTIKGLAEGTV